jgi:hypothetical protein
MRPPYGMQVDLAQLPRELKEPAMQPGQSPPGEIIGYLVDGKIYHPDDVQIIRRSP